MLKKRRAYNICLTPVSAKSIGAIVLRFKNIFPIWSIEIVGLYSVVRSSSGQRKRWFDKENWWVFVECILFSDLRFYRASA